MIGIDRHIRVGEKYLQAHTPFAHIVERFDEWIARREPLALKLPIDPVEEYLDLRFA